jgi:outer membrane protein assembly factor BamB
VLHRFDSEGRIQPGHEAIFADLAPDTATPVLAGGTLFGCCGSLYGLDVCAGLKPVIKLDDPAFDDFCSLIAGPGRLLILSAAGELLLLPTSPGAGGPKLERVQLFDTEQDIWSHPALVGPFLYVRAPDGVYCFMV